VTAPKGQRKTFPEQAILAQWLDEGLKKKFKSAKELAAILDIDATAVTRLRQNERRFLAHELDVIGRYIEEPVPLEGTGFTHTGTFNVPLGPPLPTLRLEQGVRLVPTIAVEVIAAANVWREAPPPSAVAERIAASADSRVAGLMQYACRLESQPHCYAICVKYDDIRSRPMAGDTVHVRRTRSEQYEDTIRVVRVANDRVRLQMENAADIDFPMAVTSDVDIELKGLVIGYFETARF